MSNPLSQNFVDSPFIRGLIAFFPALPPQKPGQDNFYYVDIDRKKLYNHCEWTGAAWQHRLLEHGLAAPTEAEIRNKVAAILSAVAD